MASEFNAEIHELRKLCKRGHNYQGTGQSLCYRKATGRCIECQKIREQRYKSKKPKKPKVPPKYSIEDIQKLAIDREGKCVSTNIGNWHEKIAWRCKFGHEWESSLTSVVHQSTWCPQCANKERGQRRKKYTIESMQKLAAKHGGLCLSQNFESVVKKLRWQCKKGHQWEAVPDSVKHGTWCPNCIGKNKTIEDMCRLAASRGGKCLSDTYKGRNSKLLWQCNEGHKWESAPANVTSGAWCHYCKESVGERICRDFFEQLLGCSFNRARPDWLRTKEGNKMELDGYSEVLKIAFEHQGLQHYKHGHIFAKTQSDFLKMQERDQRKRDLCKANGVILIEIPSIFEILGLDNVKEFLKQEFLKNNLTIPVDFDKKQVNTSCWQSRRTHWRANRG